MIVALSAILAMIVAWFLATPWIPETEEGDTAISSEHQSLLEQRGRCLQVLRDLDLDYALDKIVEAEYRQTRRDIGRQLQEVLKRLEAQ